MNPQELLDRIVCDPDILGGKPVVRGTRVTVRHVLKLLASGVTVQDIVAEYFRLSPPDVQACLLFASLALRDNTDMPTLDEAA